jgi:hypothetical protein
MSYKQVRDFLGKHTRLVELTDGANARVIIAPHWQGRVMTSTCGGEEGRSFGFINRAFIEGGKHDPRFNNYGGEERLWLSPEGGLFSLWFKPGVPQTLENWHTPPALNEGGWKVISSPSDSQCYMETRMALRNAAGACFLFDIARTVRLLSAANLHELFGAEFATAVERGTVKFVAYETINQLTNRGEPLRKETGLVSIWMLGMLNAGVETVVIVPYRPGSETDLGPPVKSNYFGSVPPRRLKLLPGAALFRADGKFRSKLGVSRARAKNVLGSIDFIASVLTIVQFTMPDDPTKHDYMNNLWGIPQAEPYAGDVVNSYNDGPAENGQQLGAFYELESLSPAVALNPGESLVHRQRTCHFQGAVADLDRLARASLGVELNTVSQEMLGKPPCSPAC